MQYTKQQFTIVIIKSLESSAILHSTAVQHSRPAGKSSDLQLPMAACMGQYQPLQTVRSM